MLCGAFCEDQPATPEIQQIANKMKPVVEKKTHEIYKEFEAVEYKTQVVAGTNYWIKIRVGDDRYIHIKVFESLPQMNLELTDYKVDKSKEDQL
ncbi:cystatin-A [Kogia breviceps]|uniref:cystatin-A n=1 Tax=Kogia breviceps TaxID=27615 RepID=UPI002795B3E1|nr:cystatin-A [Kogia breviceps]